MANTTIIETNDIMRVLSTGDVLTLPDGTQGLTVVLVLNPVTEKAYPDGETAFPVQIRMGTNLYQIEPMPDGMSPLTINEQRSTQGLAALPGGDPLYVTTNATTIETPLPPANTVNAAFASPPAPVATTEPADSAAPEPTADTSVQELPVTPEEPATEEAPHTLALGDTAAAKEA